ncbi:hypothetical protein J6590_050162 [Homalodisca vitripennis]|nr:hypothetical protein J6590_050162 [Homalodisca vitripennis]
MIVADDFVRGSGSLGVRKRHRQFPQDRWTSNHPTGARWSRRAHQVPVGMFVFGADGGLFSPRTHTGCRESVSNLCTLSEIVCSREDSGAEISWTRIIYLCLFPSCNIYSLSLRILFKEKLRRCHRIRPLSLTIDRD